MNLEQKAQDFATTAHRGQYRKDGKTSYIKHPEAVVDLLKGMGITNYDILSSALLPYIV